MNNGTHAALGPLERALVPCAAAIGAKASAARTCLLLLTLAQLRARPDAGSVDDLVETTEPPHIPRPALQRRRRRGAGANSGGKTVGHAHLPMTSPWLPCY